MNDFTVHAHEKFFLQPKTIPVIKNTIEQKSQINTSKLSLHPPPKFRYPLPTKSKKSGVNNRGIIKTRIFFKILISY